MPPLPGRVGELDAGDLAGEDMGDGGPDEASGRDGILLCPTGSPTEGGRGRLAAAVTVADCMPIWILDRLSGAYGLLHSGWKGTGILRHAITALVERCSADPASISVILGPAIGPCCYEVPPERARAFDREFGAASVDWSGEKPRIDLRAANIALARELGVGALLSVDTCTSCNPGLGSYRREGATDFTRMVAVCAPA